jgi:hypothetical protein
MPNFRPSKMTRARAYQDKHYVCKTTSRFCLVCTGDVLYISLTLQAKFMLSPLLCASESRKMIAPRAIDRQIVSEQELTTLPFALPLNLFGLADTGSNHGATTRLLDFEPIIMKPLSVSTQRENSQFRDFLRHVRLLLPASFLGHTLPWKTKSDQRKIAVYQSRRMAALNSLLQILPLAVAGNLLGLHWSKYWVGVSADTTSLQFAAKVHELLMQASLVDILLYIIRSQALNGYLPLGALAGAAQAPQLSYLWSLDFFSALVASSRAFQLRHKLFLMLSISALLLMTAVVGPSSAILMVSRPGMTHMQNTTIRYLNVSEADLFPTQMDKTNHLNL